MDFLHYLLLFTTVLGLASTGLFIFLLRRMDARQVQMEDFLVTIGTTIATYLSRIDSLFVQNIHYYDETIFEFVENTRSVKNEIDKVLSEYEDLREFIIPTQSPEEQEKEQEKEVLGVIRNYPITRSYEPNRNER